MNVVRRAKKNRFNAAAFGFFVLWIVAGEIVGLVGGGTGVADQDEATIPEFFKQHTQLGPYAAFGLVLLAVSVAAILWFRKSGSSDANG